MNSKLIVVCGLSGSGKTTTAKELSKRLNMACLHKDTIKSAVHDVLSLQTSKALALLVRFTEEQLANNIDLIIEGTFNFKEDELLFKKWKERYDIDLFFVICRADVSTRKNRILSRDRHICHQEADKKILECLDTMYFDYSDMPGKHINIATDRPTTEIIDIILKQIQ